MNEVARYPYIPTDVKLSELTFLVEDFYPLSDVEHFDHFGFEVTIKEGKVTFSYNKEAISILLEENIDYMSDQVQDYARYWDITDHNISEFVKFDENSTFDEIFSAMESDWKLNDEQITELKSKFD